MVDNIGSKNVVLYIYLYIENTYWCVSLLRQTKNSQIDNYVHIVIIGCKWISYISKAIVEIIVEMFVYLICKTCLRSI